MNSINDFFKETANKMSEMKKFAEAACEENYLRGKADIFEEALTLIEQSSEYQNVQFKSLMSVLEQKIQSRHSSDKGKHEKTASKDAILNIPHFNGMRIRENKKRFLVDIDFESGEGIGSNEKSRTDDTPFPHIDEPRAIFPVKKNRI
jgi:hypothetical protein